MGETDLSDVYGLESASSPQPALPEEDPLPSGSQSPATPGALVYSPAGCPSDCAAGVTLTLLQWTS